MKLGNFKKMTEILELMASAELTFLKPSFDVSCKKLQKISCKTFIEKPIFLFCFLKFVNSTTCSPRLSEETDFHSQYGPDSLVFRFLKILVFQNTYFLFKLMFRATDLQQKLKYAMLQKALFCTLASGTNLEVHTVTISVGHYL